MLDRALEEMQKKESKIVSPSLRLLDQLVDARGGTLATGVRVPVGSARRGFRDFPRREVKNSPRCARPQGLGPSGHGPGFRGFLGRVPKGFLLMKNGWGRFSPLRPSFKIVSPILLYLLVCDGS